MYSFCDAMNKNVDMVSRTEKRMENLLIENYYKCEAVAEFLQ